MTDKATFYIGTIFVLAILAAILAVALVIVRGRWRGSAFDKKLVSW